MYPENMDAHTKLLLLEAQNIFCQLSKKEVVDFVSTADFQSFWQHTNEDIQSSESEYYFGHYKVASYNRYLFRCMQPGKGYSVLLAVCSAICSTILVMSCHFCMGQNILAN